MASGIIHNIFRGNISGVKHNALIYGGSIIAATPTFQAAGAKAEGIGDVTVNWPAHIANDVALLFVETNGTEAAVLGTPAGFVEIPGSPLHDDAGGNQTRLTVFWCRASSAAMASPVITDPGDHCEAVIITYRGCRTFDVPYSATAGSTTAGVPTSSISVPGTTSGAPNCRVVIAISNGGGWDASGYTNANLTGITERFDDFTGLAGAGGLSIADGAYAGPGDYGATAVTIGAVNTCAYMSIALTGSSGSGGSSFAAALTAIGTPITAARAWTTGLSSDGYFIIQMYNYNSSDLPEWFVFNLAAGTYTKTLGPDGILANSNYQLTTTGESFSDSTGGNQVYDPNGRIFFPLRGLNIAYYDPADHLIHHITPISDPSNTHAVVFRLAYGNDGMLYGTTQADSGTSSRPIVFKLDPDTLATTVLGHVGTLPNALLYGYHLAVENGGSHVYVAVGEDPWELWSVNTATGVSTKLDPGTGPYTYIEFNKLPQGWSARFVTTSGSTDYWVVDGALYSGAPTYSGAFTSRDVTAGPVPLVNAQDIDWLESSVGNIKWRVRGGPSYTNIPFTVTKAPIPINGLVELADGDLFVAAEQYNGFARLDGSWTHLLGHFISQPVFTENGVWWTGYPNNLLYNYDSTQPWNPGVNPVLKGYFAGPNGTLSNVKYGYFLSAHPSNGRLYSAGRQERSGDGSGIGYYNIAGNSFSGHHNSPLGNYQPRGMLVLSDKVVFSGESQDGVTPAKLLVYDLDLNLTSQLTVDDRINTGLLFSAGGNIVVGITSTGAYRYNLTTQTVLTNVGLDENVITAIQHADGTILVATQSKLLTINPNTLAVSELVRGIALDYPVTNLSWIADRIRVAAGPTIYGVT